MEMPPAAPLAAPVNLSRARNPVADRPLADFSTDTRVLLLSAMAGIAGVISSFAAWVLLWLIAAITVVTGLALDPIAQHHRVTILRLRTGAFRILQQIQAPNEMPRRNFFRPLLQQEFARILPFKGDIRFVSRCKERAQIAVEKF